MSAVQAANSVWRLPASSFSRTCERKGGENATVSRLPPLNPDEWEALLFQVIMTLITYQKVTPNDELKKLLKEKSISEDIEKKEEKKIQILTDENIKKIDEKILTKEKEIMTI